MLDGPAKGVVYLPENNTLLAALPAEVLGRLRADLVPVAMPLGHVIYESGVELKHVYFPAPGCIVAMPTMPSSPTTAISAEEPSVMT